MSSLLTSSEVTFATGAANDLFDTTASRMVIYKEPIKTINSPESQDITFGYSNSQTEHTYTYTPVSGVFSGVFSRSNPSETEIEKKMNLQYAGNRSFVKVRQDCKDFIENGATERIDLVGSYWKIVGVPKKRMFLNSIYFIYTLEEAE